MSNRDDRSITVLGDWTLMDANDLPCLHQDIGAIPVEDGRQWRVGSALGVPHIYVFTDLPHPDDPLRRRIYTLSPVAMVERFAVQLVAQEDGTDA